MSYVDFSALKKRVSIEQVAQWLQLKGEEKNGQLRCICPVHGGDRGLIITYDRGLFRCMADRGKGGDCIQLTAHITGVTIHQAAQYLVDEFGTVTSDSDSKTVTVSKEHATAPQAPESRTEKSQPAPNHAFNPDKFAAKLRYTPDVEAFGLSEEDAQRLGVGYHLQRKRIYFGLRNPDGSWSGFIGWDGTKLENPPKWITSNVVNLKRPA